ncbi:MAG: DUF4202 domain-containing protein [Spirochaetales bacterium]|nr:DUF4202 domain-containing protein [Spirochaetales bacterium]
MQEVFARIDAANGADPEGESAPAALIYGQRMTACLKGLYPEAGPALQIAVRGQHIERWKLPRSDYPPGRAGYHRWRTELQRRHAERLREILQSLGADEELIGRVQHLVQKKALREDPETQALEDVACLVFLQHYLEDFSARHESERVIEILKKTGAKMSERGQEAALALDLSPASRRLLEAALA